ncbi:MAG: nucleotide-binding protein [Methanomicrobium sp.]|nr:nucleotide-binding protein [Methanomicrobium sp.]MDD4299469.1 nucleotide-binding protein [Methanomicrobium sp.]
MDIDPQVTERISRKIEEKGGFADIEKIQSKLNLLVSDFGIPVEEAERTVTNEFIRELNLNNQSGNRGSQDTAEISDINPGDWVTIEGKIVSLSTPPSPSMSQTGIIADDFGAIRFVVWAKANCPVLEERKWYRFESATVDEYRGSPSLKVHSGTAVSEIEEKPSVMPTPVSISDLKPGVATVRVKVIQDWEPRHERMFQSGIIGDESGTAKFVTWKDNNNARLEEGKVYNIYYAGVDEYQGKISLNLTGTMFVEDEGAELEISGGKTTITGAFINMGPGSGLIKRCPVEGCNRVLNRQNFCPVHEIQNKHRYDLRITGVLDNGKAATNILVPREETEKITGITLEKAIEIAENNPLGMDDVFIRMQDVLMGRYFSCRGNDMEGTLLVKSCEPVLFDSEKHTALINRADRQEREVDL